MFYSPEWFLMSFFRATHSQQITGDTLTIPSRRKIIERVQSREKLAESTRRLLIVQYDGQIVRQTR